MNVLSELLFHGPFDFSEVPICSRLIFAPLPLHDGTLTDVVWASVAYAVHCPDHDFEEQSEPNNGHEEKRHEELTNVGADEETIIDFSCDETRWNVDGWAHNQHGCSHYDVPK